MGMEAVKGKESRRGVSDAGWLNQLSVVPRGLSIVERGGAVLRYSAAGELRWNPPGIRILSARPSPELLLSESERTSRPVARFLEKSTAALMATPLTTVCPSCLRRLRIRDARLLGTAVKCPGCGAPVVLTSTSANAPTQMDLDPVRPVATKPPTPLATPQPAAHPPDFIRVDAARSGREELGRFQAAQRKRKRKTMLAAAAMIIPAIAIAATLLSLPSVAPSRGGKPPVNVGVLSPPSDGQPYSAVMLRSNPQLIEEFNPTNGPPVPLELLPPGVNLVSHFHPAWMWSEAQDARVLRAGLTDEVISWLESMLQVLAPVPPQEIASATVGVVLGSAGTPPRTSAVLRLTATADIEGLAERLGNPPSGGTQFPAELRPRLRVRGNLLTCLVEDRTLVVTPLPEASESLDWLVDPAVEVEPGLAQLVAGSDGERLLTVLGNCADVQRHLAALLPEPARLILKPVLEELGPDAESFSWSVHTLPLMFSEILVRPVSTANSQRLQRELDAQLAQMPERVWKEVCLKLSPADMRSRQFIGRFPAMLEAFRQSTVSHTGSRQVRFVTVLPAKAVPNLSLAVLFTANEEVRRLRGPGPTPQGRPAGPPQPAPATLQQRLDQLVETEFNRTPLEQALQYICSEIGVQLVVDGEALRDAGYTRNMPQTLNLGRVPARQALGRIVGRYQERDKEMVLSLDERTMTITLLTKKFAEATGLPITVFPAE